MKRFTKFLALLLCVFMLVGCSSKSTTTEEETTTEATKLEYAEGTVLRVAAGYQKTNEAISFKDADVVGDGLTLAGTTYHTGDLKPTWAYLSEYLGITFEDDFTGAGSAAKEYAYWENNLGDVDIIAGSATVLNDAGAQGKVINLADYLDQMPNFKAYLEENQIARLSITGNTSSGAIYFSPYFDGNNDIERMPLMRADLVRELLDGDTAYKGANRTLATAVYEPYMPTTGTVAVESLNAAGDGTQTITKDYSKYGNIIDKMNAAGTLTGDQAVQMLRDYIDATYGDTYAKRSDLFLGYDAAWDADELVALMRCAAASLTDTDGNAMVPLYSRETNNNQRDVDMFRFAGTLFGVRGTESRQDYLYFDKDGNLHDGRGEADMYEACERMNALVQEGLLQTEGSGTSKDYLTKNAGLVSYDYNQTQTIYNNTINGIEYVAVMVPVAKWNDGTGDQYMRFTESWRSVKTDGWAISAAGVEGNADKLNAALTLIDYAFSVQGQITMSYGPDDFIKVKDASVEVTTWADVAKKYETFDFNGQAMPVVSDDCFNTCAELTGGNYTNFARRYLGSTLNGFPKSQAFEYQMTSEVGKKGSAILSAAISYGTIKHPDLAVRTDNMWYTSVPTVFPTTSEQTELIKSYSDLTNKFSTAADSENILYTVVKSGLDKTIEGIDSTPEAYAEYVKTTYNSTAYLAVRQAQWTVLQAYYNTLNK